MRAFVPDAKKAITNRGGAGPLAPLAVAKIAGGLSLAQGIYTTLAPKPCAEVYSDTDEAKELNPLNAKLLRRLGMAVLHIGVSAYCLFFQDYSIETSVALTSLTWVMESLSSLFNDDSDTIGPSKISDLSILAFNGANVYAALNHLDWFETSFKAFSVYTFACGLPCLLFPETAMDIWQVKNGDELTPGIVVSIGSQVTVLGVLISTLAWGVDPVKSFGYTALSGAVLLSKVNFFSQEVDELNMNKKFLAFWPVFNAFVAASILL